MNTLKQAIAVALDKLALVQERKSKLKSNRHKILWSRKISNAKRMRRQLERRYLKTRLTIHKQMLASQINRTRQLVKTMRNKHYS